MKIKSIAVHNFRSIKHSKFDVKDYGVLIGANNVGKSNVLTALRIFYEDGIKFTEKTDFPKFDTDDNEGWIEIEYSLTDIENTNLKDEYKQTGNILKVRKYLKSSDNNRVRANQSNIYGYIGDTISDNLFYGARNISEAKLGSVVYIPEVLKTDDTVKLSGPSPLRDVITFVMKKVVKTSESFDSLNRAFEDFNSKFQEEASKDGFSLNRLRGEINESLREWEVEFNLNINSARPEDIIRNLVSHHAIDRSLNKEVDIKSLGQGLQRHLIYTLLKLSSQYTEKKTYKKKEFSPELTLILFEEPEAFLHPGQQEFLNSSLKSLSREEGQQVIVATHSPIFVSKNIEDITDLIKLKKDGGVTHLFQVLETTRKKILEENNELAQLLEEKLADPSVGQPIKRKIRELLGDTEDDMRMEEESIRYQLWLDSERCAAFFADIVLICEGATEKTFIDYLIRNNWHDLQRKRIYILDAMGKYNIHRYMNLLNGLGIYHSVLYDRDEDRNIEAYVNRFVEDQKNDSTKSIDSFETDIETFLGIDAPPSNRRDKKPLNVMWHYSKNKISQERIEALKNKMEALL